MFQAMLIIQTLYNNERVSFNKTSELVVLVNKTRELVVLVSLIAIGTLKKL